MNIKNDYEYKGMLGARISSDSRISTVNRLTETNARIMLNHWSASVPRRRAVQELNGKMSSCGKRAPLVVLTDQRV
jgi:hypothetical protein